MKGRKEDKETMTLIRRELLKKTPLSYLCVRLNELHGKWLSFLYYMCVQHN